MKTGQVQSIIEGAFNNRPSAVVVCTKCGHEFRWDMRADQVPGKRCGYDNCGGKLADPRENIEAQRFYLANLLIQSGVAIPEGAKVVIEHGTCELKAEPTAADRTDGVQGYINRLHAERGPLVERALRIRMDKGVTSPEFANAWFDVERITADLVEAEAVLVKGGVE